MKKYLFIIAALSMMACGNSTKNSGETAMTDSADAEVVVECTLDSTRKGNKYAIADVAVRLPKGDGKVERNIRKALNDIAHKYLSMKDYSGKVLFAPVEEDMIKDGITPSYCQFVFDCLEKDSKENYDMTDEEFRGDEPMVFSVEYALNPVYATNKMMVYEEKAYIFTGGAHGLESLEYFTFDMSDGKVFDDFIKDVNDPGMQTVMKKGLRRYYRECGIEVESDDDLFEYLFIEDGIIPMPKSALRPTKDGLMFVYQPYEIASYAAGCICFTCPYDELEPYMTEKGKIMAP